MSRQKREAHHQLLWRISRWQGHHRAEKSGRWQRTSYLQAEVHHEIFRYQKMKLHIFIHLVIDKILSHLSAKFGEFGDRSEVSLLNFSLQLPPFQDLFGQKHSVVDINTICISLEQSDLIQKRECIHNDIVMYLLSILQNILSVSFQ